MSSDKSQDEFINYFKTMPWVAFPYERQAIGRHASSYSVRGIPCLLVVDENGKVLDQDGRGGVMQGPSIM